MSLFFFNVEAATWKKINTKAQALTAQVTICPANYVGVPPMLPYTTRFFCVAKYEMKNDRGNAFSVHTGTPWINISGSNAREYCKSNGSEYDLISNSQWQALAINISRVGSNWSSGVVADGELNVGHSDGSPSNMIAAVTDDNDPCNGTGQTCTGSTWNSQKRTHKLSTGEVVWDLSGNAYELTTLSLEPNVDSRNISEIPFNDSKNELFGADKNTICINKNTSPYCGMGKLSLISDTGFVARGNIYSSFSESGIFSARKMNTTNSYVGFRCVFVP